MDLSEPIYIADLIVRSFTENLSADEKEKIEQWRKASEANEKLYQQIISLEGLRKTEEQLTLFTERSGWKNFHKHIHRFAFLSGSRKMLKYAALLIPFGLIVGLGWYLAQPGNSNNTQPLAASTALPAIPYGSSKAILVLNDGSQLNLEGKAAFETADATIKNTANTGMISYKKNDKSPVEEPRVNRLVVPNGGEYNVELADGTLVFLNAGSELAYPVNFSGPIREVSLKGEAYFKVAPDKNCPFVVKTQGIAVRVLGTEFNLNAYEGQKYIATTLVNGSVEINVEGRSSAVRLTPDHQARFDKETSRVECIKVNTLPYTAWKDGKFVFYHEALGNITEKLEKWYDVNIGYADEALKEFRMFGIISRYEDIREVLNLLKSTHIVDFRYIDGKIQVVPYGLK